MSVSLNGNDFNEIKKLPLTFTSAKVISKLEPSIVFTSGQTYITIFGQGFSQNFDMNQVNCIIDEIYSRAIIVDDTTLLCLVPSHQAVGTYSVDVTFNGQDVTGYPLSLVYVATPFFKSLLLPESFPHSILA